MSNLQNVLDFQKNLTFISFSGQKKFKDTHVAFGRSKSYGTLMPKVIDGRSVIKEKVHKAVMAFLNGQE